jgi:putative ABC transport system permease protein
MNIWESIQVAFEAMRANRLRSGLTMLGLIFGVGAVIAAVSLTEGAKAATLARFAMMGTNTLTVRPGQASQGPVGGGMGSQNTLTIDDAYAIRSQVKNVVGVAPQVNGRAQVEAEGNNTSTMIIGTTPASEQAEAYKMAEGSFFSDEDVNRSRKVAVVGPTVVANLFGKGQKVAGSRVRIGRSTFRIVGQWVSKGNMGFRDPDDQILIPVTTAITKVLGAAAGSTQGRQTVRSIVVQVTDMSECDRTRDAITALLRDRHRIRTGAPEDFQVMSVSDVIQGAQEASKVLTLLFGSIAAVSLLVGGIGIMNIMLVSVTERTREIGLRKSVGATPGDIMTQFLVESSTLSMAGGVIGVLAGIAAVPIVAQFGLNAKVSPPWVGIAFMFAAAVGVVFGLLPARKAAALTPVEALRYE